jgi:histidine triad (HIT) family protein
VNPQRPLLSDENCPFCQIVAGRVEAKVVFEDEVSMAFLDSRPLFPGHCLLIPRSHYETLSGIPNDLIAPLFSNAQHLARGVQEAMGAEGTFVGMNNVVSQSVPHFHIHIVPRRRKDGLRGFFWPRHKYASDEEANAVRDIITSHLKSKIWEAPFDGRKVKL